MLRILKSLVIVLAMTGVARAGSFDLFWADSGNGSVLFGNGRVERASLDGSPRETIFFAGADRPQGIALDNLRGQVYWTVGSSQPTIRRANLDGSGEEIIFQADLSESRPQGITVDAANGKLYWVDSNRRSVRRSNLDGSGIEDLVEVSEQSALEDIALDLVNGRMYWTDRTVGRIQSANLDGSDVQTILEGGLISQPFGIDVDPENGIDPKTWPRISERNRGVT